MNPFLLRIAAVAIVCLVVGGAVGRFLLAPPPRTIVKRVEVQAKSRFKASETVFLKWTMVSAFPGDTPQFGTLGKRFTAKLRRASAGTMQITFADSGTPIAPENCFDAVADERVQACWSTPGYWRSKEKALALFSGVPFGPDAKEYMAWYYYGGGRELLEKIYNRHGLKSVLCGVTAPEGGGWFKQEIKTVDDFKGMKIRIFGLGARVVEKLGATPLRLKGSEIVKALKDGQISGAEYSIPAIDVNLGLHNVVKNYYLPGWHKPAALLEFLVSAKAWEELPNPAKGMIMNACGDTLREGLAEGAAMQPAAIRELRVKGVTIRAYPKEVLTALQTAWRKVVEEESASNALFKEVWRSLSSFRAEYKLWEDRSQLRQ